ncbi:MAG: glycosyltransferase family 4 protein [Cyclobacteriaceae bacterium]
MENKGFPRVLILIQPFNTNTGGGITLTNLFRGWPKDSIAVACRGYVINRTTQTDICNQYYQLGQKEQKWIFPFNLIRRKYYSGILDFSLKDDKKIVSKKSKNRVNFSKKYIDPLLTYLGFSHVLSDLSLSPQFCDWVDDFQPDIIYAQAAGRSTNAFCAKVQEYLKKPMVFHMMDDWPELLKEQSLFGKYWHKKIDLEVKDMLSKCSLHLAISESMAREYKSRYGIDFLTFHNPIDLSFWMKGQKKAYNLSQNIHILYAVRM